MADALKQVHNMGVKDGLFAPIAIEREAKLATRNLRDFKFTLVDLVNPCQHNLNRLPRRYPACPGPLEIVSA